MFNLQMSIFLRLLIFPFTSIESYKNDFIKTLSEEKSYEGYWKKYNNDFQVQLYNALNREYSLHNLDYVDMIIQKYYGFSYIEGRSPEEIYIDILSKFAKSFICHRNGSLALKYWESEKDDEFIGPYKGINKIALWNTLNRMMCTNLIVICYLLDNGMNDEKFLKGYYSSISLEDIQLEKVLSKGVAETHIHSNAGINFTITWQHLMNLNNLNDKGRKNYLDKLLVDGIRDNKEMSNLVKGEAILRLLMIKFLEYEEGPFYNWIEQFKEDCSDDGLVYDIFYSMEEGSTLKDGTFEDIDFENAWEHLKSKFNFTIPEGKDEYAGIFLGQSEKFKTTGENIFLFKALKHIKQYNDKLFAKMFFQYIRIKNVVFQAKVQQDNIKGLKNFQPYYGRSSKIFGMNGKHKWLTIMHCQFQNKHLRKLEFRFGFGNKKKELKKQIKSFLQAYDEFISEWEIGKNQRNNSNLNPPKIGLIFHMIKRLDNEWYDKCWQNTYKLEDDSDKSRELFYNANQQYYKKQIEIFNELRREVPELDKFLIGIDAASIEDNTEPWVFAPVYRMARNSEDLAMVYDSDVPMQTLGFTFHVGEDFRHLLTGLRHVDEVVEHFSYHAGDRIGHGIALGVNPEYWCSHNEIVMLPRGEYLDDLLWVWGISKDKKGLQYIDVGYLEQKIMEIAESIFGTIDGITVYMLWKAYNAKFEEFEPDRRFQWDFSNTDRNELFCKYLPSNVQARGQHWTYEALLYVQHCKCYAEKFLEPIQVSVESDSHHLYGYLQQLLLDKINNNGIIIETNPTSNLSIGEMKDLFNHYIFNLNDLDESNEHSRAIISINSDDPSVFNTNVSNEISYIFYALQKKGYSREEALRWIDKIRKYGMESSFLQDEDITVEELQGRIKRVLKALEK